MGKEVSSFSNKEKLKTIDYEKFSSEIFFHNYCCCSFCLYRNRNQFLLYIRVDNW